MTRQFELWNQGRWMEEFPAEIITNSRAPQGGGFLMSGPDGVAPELSRRLPELRKGENPESEKG